MDLFAAGLFTGATISLIAIALSLLVPHRHDDPSEWPSDDSRLTHMSARAHALAHRLQTEDVDPTWDVPVPQEPVHDRDLW